MAMDEGTEPTPADFLAIGREAASRYGFSSDVEMSRYELTENWMFRVQDASDHVPAVLRIYRPGVKSRDEIRSELAWMTALREEAGLPVPRVFDTEEGRDLLEVQWGGQTIFCAAFELAHGLEPAEAELVRWFPYFGTLTAHMHRHARAWRRPPWFTRMRWDVDTTLGPRGHWGRWDVSVPDPAERRQLGQLADVVVDRLNRFGTGAERFGLVHADLRLANVLVDGDKVTILDFDDCGDSWYLYDLAATLTFNEGRPDVDELIAAWVDAYRTVEPLSREDEAEIKTFLMLRRLMLSAYVGLRDDTDLARELGETGFSGETCRLAESYLSEVARPGKAG
jgi:Ser/Thr protein kinase RdoA (MazF antagonist)